MERPKEMNDHDRALIAECDKWYWDASSEYFYDMAEKAETEAGWEWILGMAHGKMKREIG